MVHGWYIFYISHVWDIYVRHMLLYQPWLWWMLKILQLTTLPIITQTRSDKGHQQSSHSVSRTSSILEEVFWSPYRWEYFTVIQFSQLYWGVDLKIRHILEFLIQTRIVNNFHTRSWRRSPRHPFRIVVDGDDHYDEDSWGRWVKGEAKIFTQMCQFFLNRYV